MTGGMLVNTVRGTASDIIVLVLLFAMVRPKCKQRYIAIFFIGVLLVNFALAFYFYRDGNLTMLAKYNTILYIAVFIAAKPLFSGTWMQWVFNVVTTLNIFCAAIVLSFWLSDWTPYPYYGNIIFRILIIGAVAALFYYRLRGIYQAVSEYWHVYIIVIIPLFVNYIWYFLFTEDIEKTFRSDMVPLILLIILSVCVYIGIFLSLKVLSWEYELREENIRSRAREGMLQNELAAYQERIEAARQNRHDMRHHNGVILEYLNSGDSEGAKEYLSANERRMGEMMAVDYCQNHVANAVIRMFGRKAKEAGIGYHINADIPEKIPFIASDVGSLLANILENAVHACTRTVLQKPELFFHAECREGRLLIELRNTSDSEPSFENSMPVSTRKGGGTGTKSVSAVVNRYHGMVHFYQQNQVFHVRIILPLETDS